MTLARLSVPIGLSVALLLGCGGEPSAESRASAIAKELMALWESGETARLDELFVTDAVYDDYPNATRYTGIEEIRGYVGHVHSWASKVEIDVVALHGDDRSAAAEWVMTGVQDRPIPGRVPVATGRSFRLRGVTVVDLEGSRIRRAGDYIDIVQLVLALGGRIELPGGGVLGGTPAEAVVSDDKDSGEPQPDG